MAPPAFVYVFAAVVGVAAAFAFKEFVYEPHLAPTLEAWAEDFLERRRAARNRRASAVRVRASRRHSSSSSTSSPQNNDLQRDRGEDESVHGLIDFEAFELEALASREVDEWRNEVLRSQESTRDGLRKRTTSRFKNDFDGFDSISTTLDESFTSITHTPLASTHVISNVSSPITPSTVSLPQTPTGRLRSASQSTMLEDVGTSFIVPHSPIHEIPALAPRTASPNSALPTSRSPTSSASRVNNTSSFPLAIPIADRQSLVVEGAPCPFPFIPTDQVMADDSPFGPLLPDTPRSSAEMYGERPFSPITRVMESSSSSVSTASSKETISSRANSMNSTRTLGSSAVLRKPSGLVNEVASGSDGGSNEGDHPDTSTSTFTLPNLMPETNGSVISSLSERYPAPPTPPVFISPPASSVGIISAPSSPRSGSSEVVVHHDALVAEPHSFTPPLLQTHFSLPTLQLPSESSSPRLASRSQSSATSPALSYTSFLSPMPISRAASGSEGDEFLSVASDDSGWNASPITPGGHTGPMQDKANNPFLDFEHLAHGARAGSSEHGDGSEGSEVFVSDVGQEGGSEVGSDESWSSARRH